MEDQKTEELKTRRITVRISGSDLELLQQEATRRNTTLGAVVRDLIRATRANHANSNGHTGHNGHSAHG
jgi:hypothetical protein